MKAILILAIAMMMTACQLPDDIFDDDPLPDTNDFTKEITGSWTWVQSSGGIAGMTYYQKNYPNHMTMNFDGTMFFIYSESEVVQSGTYKLEYKFSELFNEKCWIMTPTINYVKRGFFIYFLFQDELPVKVKIENGQLFVIYPCCDMFDSIFDRNLYK
jgi:hypothetical protein